MNLRPQVLRWLAPAATALVAAGCATTETAAPLVQSIDSAGHAQSQLEQGRRIYLGKCTACHAPEPIHKYTQSQWMPIMAEMAQEANLSAPEDAAVRAYVFSVLQTPKPG